ncbi:MAG: flagellar hook-basal body complex protein FliE [Rhodospirillaceae bacterium]
MAIDFGSAVKAYGEAAKIARDASATGIAKTPVAPAENSFANMITDSLQSAMHTGRQAEELSLKQISGEADLKDVVTAVANAEHTLETVVAVRDKVLSAYQEILRMPI